MTSIVALWHLHKLPSNSFVNCRGQGKALSSFCRRQNHQLHTLTRTTKSTTSAGTGSVTRTIGTTTKSAKFISNKPVSISSSITKKGLHARSSNFGKISLRQYTVVISRCEESLLHPGAFMNGPEIISFHNNGSPSSSSQSQFMMASSPVADDGHNANLLQKVWNWIKRKLLYAYDGVILTGRLLEISIRLSPMTILTPLAMLTHYLSSSNNKGDGSIDTDNAMANFAWAYFMHSMQKLGPSFVKLCQWIATRRDMFPPNVCDRLAALHDRGYPHKWSYSHTVLCDAFGDDYEAKGLTIDNKNTASLGCGSAAQVYRGTLRIKKTDLGGQNRLGDSNKNNNKNDDYDDDGYIEKPVAVKILHPRFKKLVRRDMWLMEAVANFLHSLPIRKIHALNLPSSANTFGAILIRQSDLTLEAENLKKFGKNFQQNNRNSSNMKVMFPQPIEGWYSERVLVEDLVDHSKPIAEFLKDSSKEGQKIRRELAGPLLQAFLKMVFRDNFVHADLHPGNVLVKTYQVEHHRNDGWFPFFDSDYTHNDSEPVVETKRTIVFLDAGIASSLGPNDLRNLLDLFRAVLTNKGDEAGRLMIERSKNPQNQTPEEVEAFSKGVGALVSEFHDNRKNGLTLGATRIGSLLSRVLDLCRVYNVEIDPAMASVVISTLILEGLGRSLEPDLNLMQFALPFVLNSGGI